MFRHDDIIGTVVRDAHNGFWLQVGVHTLPLSREIEEMLRQHVQARPIQCSVCAEAICAVPTAV